MIKSYYFPIPFLAIIACNQNQFFGGSNWKGTESMLFEYSPTDKDWLLTRKISESYYQDKRHYQSDTSLAKDHGKVLLIKEYCP